MTRKPKVTARQRAEFIMKVRCGLMTASQAAEKLGVSRKTYYKWEQRGLAALLDSVSDQKAGRPEKTAQTRESVLEKHLADMTRQNELLRQKMALKDIASGINVRSGSNRRKKNEQIMQAIAQIERLKMQFALPYSVLVEETNFSYASFIRWKRRIANGQPPVEAPGPKKIEPFDLGNLSRKIESLKHGKKRSRGTGVLHRAYKLSLSRRELNAMVSAVRQNNNRHRVAAQSRVIWRQPDLAWALDGSEYNGGCGGRLHVQNLQDLCSQYKFPPLATGYFPCGEEVAGHSDHYFTRFGPPLFFKRDNGGNMNHMSINQLFDQAMVIPINSPTSNAAYNGAIEHAQGEFKGYLGQWQNKANSVEELILLAETAAHELHHKPRRSLGGKNACQSYFGGDRLRFSKRKRKAAYRWIQDLAMDLSEAAGKNIISPVAWRLAAKKWLVENKMIMILKVGKVLPHFSSNLCHN